MKDDMKKAGKNPQDCGSKCAGESKKNEHCEKNAHGASKEHGANHKTEHKKW